MKARRRAPDQKSNLSRYTGRGTGWRVFVNREGRTWWRWFSDARYGGAEGALHAAIGDRDRLWIRLRPPVGMPRRARNNTGIVGVTLESSRIGGRRYFYYRATWPHPSGLTMRRAFSIKKHGKASARALAVDARREGVRHYVRVMRGRIRSEVEARRRRDDG